MRTTALLTLAVFMPSQVMAASVLPTGGQVVAGSASIATGANSVTVNQSSNTAIVNWNSFSIGAGNSVQFNNGSGATLSRVTGNITSLIDGSLSATGSLYLVNPAGVVVGPGGTVTTGGSFIASTHDIADGDFLDGGAAEFAGASNAEIVNNGTISSASGDVALIARKVDNAGTISTPNGTTALAAGYDVLMSDASGADGKFAVKVGGSDTAVVNSGTIRAAEVEMRANGGNVYALAGNTDSIVKATGVSSSGGRIFLTAGSGGTVRSTAHVVARASRVQSNAQSDGRNGGTILVKGGRVDLAGTIDVSATGTGTTGGTITAIASGQGTYAGDLLARGGEGGSGGLVETSGHTVNFGGLSVDTSATNGSAGLWLVDPQDLTVDSASAATIAANLATTSVTLQTTATTASGTGVITDGGNGDITVNSAISWSSANTLTLDSYNDIALNAAINAPLGALNISAAGSVSAQAIDVNTFNLASGAWSQIGGTLPSFSANSFELDTANASFLRALSGDGSVASPYQIADIYGLQGLASHSLLAMNFALANDFGGSGTVNWNGGAGFQPIGDATNKFTGSLDGQGHSITGFTIDRPTSNYVGLFGYLNGATVKNLTFIGDLVSGQSYVGGIAGDNVGGTIDNVFGYTPVQAAGSTFYGGSTLYAFAGGLAGASSGTISNSGFAQQVNATGNDVGGLVGTNAYGSVLTNSYAIGLISAASSSSVGGLAGVNVGTITRSYNLANVSGASYVGGAVGTNVNGGSISLTYSRGTVAGSGSSIGGLVGNNSQGAISNSYATGAVSGGTSVGGLIGTNYLGASYATSVANNYATGAISGSSSLGGLIGNNYVDPNATGTISGNFWNTTTTGRSAGIGTGTQGGVTGLDSAGMTDLSNFTAAGWSIDDAGGTGATWRIYDGETAPLLRFLLTPVTVTADNASKTYDGSAYAGFTYTSSDSNAGFDGTLGSNLTSANAGTYSIDRGLYSDQFGYDITMVAGTLTIDPAKLTVTVDAQSREYGNANPSLTYSYSGFVNGDTSSLFSGSLATSATTASNVGDYAITQGTLSAGGNYSIAYSGANLSVTARPITVAADSLSRLYGDANPAFTYTIGGDGLVNGDTLSGSLTTSATTSSNVGKYAITQGTLAASSNYSLSYTSGTLTIDPAKLTVTADAQSREYGNANPSLTYSYSGFVNGDTSSLFTGALATSATTTSNVGSYAITQGTLSAGGNYAIAYTGANLSVTARPITVTADNLSRLYGATNPAFTYTIGGDGLVNGDTLSGSLTTSATTSSNVGKYAITQGTLAASSNYSLSYTSGTLTIDPAKLTVTADAQSREYGNANPSLTYSYSGFVNGDSASLFTGSLATSATATSNVGNYAITQGTLSAGGNYSIAYTGANLSVTARSVTVTADNLSRLYGAANPALTYTIGGDGLVNGDALSGSLTTAATAASNVGNYAITQGTLSASGNYSLTYVPGTLAIDPALLTITANNAGKVYDGAAYSGGNGVIYSGFVNGETASVLSGTLAYGGTSQGAIDAGTYDITASGLSSSNYAISYQSGTLDVSARPITVTADDKIRSVGAANPVLTYGLTSGSLVRGDSLTGSLETTADAASPAGNYAITQGTLTAGANYALTFVPGRLTVNGVPLTTAGLPNPYAIAQNRVNAAPGPTLSYTCGRAIDRNAVGADANLTTGAIGSEGGSTGGDTVGTTQDASSDLTVTSRLIFAPGTFDVSRCAAEVGPKETGEVAPAIGAALSSSTAGCTIGVAGPAFVGVPYPCNKTGEGG